jgi:hypothetical protein
MSLVIKSPAIEYVVCRMAPLQGYPVPAPMSTSHPQFALVQIDRLLASGLSTGCLIPGHNGGHISSCASAALCAPVDMGPWLQANAAHADRVSPSWSRYLRLDSSKRWSVEMLMAPGSFPPPGRRPQRHLLSSATCRWS